MENLLYSILFFFFSSHIHNLTMVTVYQQMIIRLLVATTNAMSNSKLTTYNVAKNAPQGSCSMQLGVHR